jgi:hypothetical protein
VKRDSRNLEVFDRAGGFAKVTEVLRWVDAGFPAADTERAPLGPSAAGWTEAAGRNTAYIFKKRFVGWSYLEDSGLGLEAIKT